jgi:sucrose-phosphate synthase
MNQRSGSKRLYVQMHSMHGLLRGHDLELGRDEDTGGQIVYVLSLAREFGKLDDVEKVDIITRMIEDEDYPGYSERIEPLAEKVDIVRIRCGGDGYIKKVDLWPYLGEFIENTKVYIKEIGRAPNILHSHYADSGYVCTELSRELGIPQVHTAHSLGKPKMRWMGVDEQNFDDMEWAYHFSQRIKAEQKTLEHAACICASTDQERREQWGMYDVDVNDGRFVILSPCTDLERFYPFYQLESETTGDIEVRERLKSELEKALLEPQKPIIYSLGRLERRKNIPGLIQAYGMDRGLQEISNVVFSGGMGGDDPSGEAGSILVEMQSLIERYRIEGRVYLRGRLDFEAEVPELYRIVARNRGVFVNPALTEPFGLTILEAASCGLPVVATDSGGPQEIISNGENGFLANVEDPKNLADAIKKLLGDHGLWERFSKAGRENAVSNFSWPGMARKQVDIFRAILGGSFNA